MPFIPLFETHPELASQETRSIILLEEQNGLSAGAYDFTEFFCDECDCRFAYIYVIGGAKKPERLAVFTFGWESASFYKKHFSFINNEQALMLKGPSLAVGQPQSKYSAELLKYFKEVTADSKYVDRIKRHYDIFRRDLAAQHKKNVPYNKSEPAISRNAPCPCGSGKKYKKCCAK